jgi:hypothetical protein
MADLRFVGAPRKRKPRKVLLAGGLVVLLAAAFGVGRLWTRPPAPETAPSAPTASPSEPASPVPAVAATAPPGAESTVASVPAQPRLLTSSEVFVITRPQAPAAPPAATATPREPETLAKQIARCLSFTVRRDNMFTVTSGVRLLIKAQNHCGQTFPGAEARFEIRAMAANGSGLGGRERGSFQTSIQPFDSAETVIVVPCDPDGVYRFEVEVM